MLKTLKENKLIIVIALLSLVLRLMYLSPWLEDWDSVQFALALHNFDIGNNLPHAPGYILYVFLGYLILQIVQNDALSLSLLSAISGSCVVVLTYLLAQKTFSTYRGEKVVAHIAAIFVALLPISLMMSVSPLTNIVGLATLLVLALVILFNNNLKLISFLAGFILGFRFTEFPVIATFLIVLNTNKFTIRKSIVSVCFFLFGIAVWIIPTIIISGFSDSVRAYKWIAGYVLKHDSLIFQQLPLQVSLVARIKQLVHLLSLAYHPVFLIASGFGFLLSLRKKFWKSHSGKLITLWLGVYSFFLMFVYNLEVPRYTLPLLVPLVIFFCFFVYYVWSKRPIIAITITAICLVLSTSQGLSQITRYKYTLPPTIAITQYIRNTFSPKDTLLVGTYTYRQMQYYLPEFRIQDKLPTSDQTQGIKYILVDYEGLKNKILTSGNATQTNETKFSGDDDIFTRISKVTLFTVELTDE